MASKLFQEGECQHKDKQTRKEKTHLSKSTQENIPWKEFAEAFYRDIAKEVLPQEKHTAIGPYVPSLLVNQIMSKPDFDSQPSFPGEKTVRNTKQIFTPFLTMLFILG